jgi:hypothetical protein
MFNAASLVILTPKYVLLRTDAHSFKAQIICMFTEGKVQALQVLLA